MKKSFFALGAVALLLLGAGCKSTANGEVSEPTGERTPQPTTVNDTTNSDGGNMPDTTDTRGTREVTTQSDTNVQAPVTTQPQVPVTPKTETKTDTSSETKQEVPSVPPVQVKPEVKAEVKTQAEVTVSVKDFTVVGSNFTFSPTSLKVKKGDKVRITFKNSGGFHDFVLDEFGVATKQIADGAQEVVEFTANKVGSFEYYCSVGSHRAMGMKGILTVTE